MRVCFAKRAQLVFSLFHLIKLHVFLSLSFSSLSLCVCFFVFVFLVVLDLLRAALLAVHLYRPVKGIHTDAFENICYGSLAAVESVDVALRSVSGSNSSGSPDGD